MVRRVFGAIVFAAVLLLGVTSAGACPSVRPLRLDTHTLSVAAPTPPNSNDGPCDVGSELYCGYVIVEATFSGLDGHPRPAPSQADGDLTGTVHVSRVYGCQNAVGTRLHRYDRTVVDTEPLETRRGFGFTLPPHGNTVTIDTYAFLLDAQPGNCPSGTTAMIYQIKARGAKLTLSANTVTWTWVPPTTNYSAPGRAQWRGAVPTLQSTATSP